YSDWGRNGETNRDWVASDRVTSVPRDNVPGRADEAAIIDVPEEPLLPPRQPPPPPPPREPVRAQYDAPQDARYVDSPEPTYMTAPPPPPEARFVQRPPPPPPPPQPEPEPQPQMQDWQPVAADGQWLPPGTPGSSWVGGDPTGAPAGPRRARHSTPGEPL